MARHIGIGMTPSQTKLGKFIRARRIKLGLSQNDLAEKLGMGRANVSLIELGALNLNQSDRTAERLAEFLKLDAVTLKSLRPKRKVNKVKEAIRQGALSGFLTARRLELKLSQKEVAERAGISSHTVHSVETGRRSASIKVLGKVAQALECKIPLKLVPKLAKLALILRQSFMGPAAS